MSEVAIERGRPQDAAQIAALFVAARSTAMPWLAEVHDEADVARHVAERVLPALEVHVARHGDEVLGFIALDADQVDHLYVRPDAQRAGLGSRLLATAMARHPAGLELWVFQRNDAAREFYAAHGFVELRRTDGSGNEEREPDVRLAWRG